MEHGIKSEKQLITQTTRRRNRTALIVITLCEAEEVSNTDYRRNYTEHYKYTVMLHLFCTQKLICL